MANGSTGNSKAVGIAVVIAVLIILFPLAFSIVSLPFSNVPDPFLEMPDAEMGPCVREKEYMRYHHMDLLKELREKAVREGKRGDIGLKSCAGCHVNRDGFCNRCHNAVSLSLDCFGCHYYPDQAAKSDH
jgi:hypothetical protein